MIFRLISSAAVPRKPFASSGTDVCTASDAAWAAIDGRSVPIASFYANLKVFEEYYEKKLVSVHHADQ